MVHCALYLLPEIRLTPVRGGVLIDNRRHTNWKRSSPYTLSPHKGGRCALRFARSKSHCHGVHFEAAVSREAAQRRLVDELLGLFGGRSRPIMAHLIESGTLTLDDVREAERTLLKLAGEEKPQ
jgi:hypothetical protein